MVNQTTEILIGISNQTGIQINELLNMMSTYYVYTNICNLISLVVFLLLSGFVVMKIYRYVMEKNKDDKYFDEFDVFMKIIIPSIFVTFIIGMIISWVEQCILGIIFPKETIIHQMVIRML